MKKKAMILSLFLLGSLVYAQESTVESSEIEAQIADVAEVVDSSREEVLIEVTDSTYAENLDYTIAIGDKYFASPKARFSVQGVDAQSGLKEILVSVDGSVFAPYKQPISFTTEGEHTLLYKFIDHVGNESYSQPYSVTIDATAPRVLDLVLDPVPFRASGFEYVGPNTSFEFNAFDDITGVSHLEYSVNSSEKQRFQQKTSLAELGFTQTAVLTFAYTATDKVGNISSEIQKSFILDATAPKVHVFANKAFEKDGIRYMSNRDHIIVEAFDQDTGVQKILYSVTGEEFKEYDPKVGIRIEKDGAYTVRVKAIDMVGNISEDVLYDVVIDSAPPQGSASYVGYQQSQNSSLEALLDPSQRSQVTSVSSQQVQQQSIQTQSSAPQAAALQTNTQNNSLAIQKPMVEETVSSSQMETGAETPTKELSSINKSSNFSEVAPDEDDVAMSSAKGLSEDEMPCKQILEEE